MRSEFLNVILGLSLNLFATLPENSQSQQLSLKSILKDIATEMDAMLSAYDLLLNSQVARFSQKLGPRTPNKFITDSAVSGLSVTFPVRFKNHKVGDDVDENEHFIIDQLLYINNQEQYGTNGDEITSLLRSTATADKKTDPLKWWIINGYLFLKLAKVAIFYFSVQAISVCSK